MAHEHHITAINPTVRPAGWYRIKLRGTAIAVLHPFEYKDLNISVGDPITPQLRIRLKEAENRSVARDYCERLLGKRAFSTEELRQLLLTKVRDRAAVDTIIRDFTESGAINDMMMAEALARKAFAKGESLAFVKRDIERHLIPPIIARHAAATVENDLGLSDHQRGLALAKRHMVPSLAAEPDHVQRRRLVGVLARKGFDEDTVESILESLLGPPPLRIHPE